MQEMLILCIHSLLLLACFGGQNVLSSAAHFVPVETLNATSGGACPSDAQLTQAKQNLRANIASILDEHVVGTETNPATSCSDLLANSPAGYYWIVPSSASPPTQRYCSTAAARPGACGDSSSWTRVAFLNMSDAGQNCPNAWQTKGSPVRTCGRGKTAESGCISAEYPTPVPYTKVCGRILAYHDGAPDGFNTASTAAVEGAYLDGISLTHGSPRHHIWSFVAALGEVGDFGSQFLCDCSNSGNWPYSVPFVGNNYFCDTANHAGTHNTSQTYYDDPLWDGQGCGLNSTCCQFQNPPWFSASLPEPSTDDLEVRNCGFQYDNYDTLVELIEIYIQ